MSAWTDVWMDGVMSGRMDRCWMDEQSDVWMDGWMSTWMSGWIDEYLDEWMGRCLYGRTDVCMSEWT